MSGVNMAQMLRTVSTDFEDEDVTLLLSDGTRVQCLLQVVDNEVASVLLRKAPVFGVQTPEYTPEYSENPAHFRTDSIIGVWLTDN